MDDRHLVDKNSGPRPAKSSEPYTARVAAVLFRDFDNPDGLGADLWLYTGHDDECVHVMPDTYPLGGDKAQVWPPKLGDIVTVERKVVAVNRDGIGQ